MRNIIFISISIIGVLIVLNLFLIFYLLKIRKRLNLFFQGEKGENFERFLVNQVKSLERQDKDIKEIFSKISKLEELSKKTFQKIGLIRFNPFDNMGGNQSFVIALLDKENNGFVISGLYTREGNRIYTKPVRAGNSEYTLSDEEKEAIAQAMNRKS